MQTRVIKVVVREDGTISVSEWEIDPRLFGTTVAIDAALDVEKRIYRLQKEMAAVSYNCTCDDGGHNIGGVCMCGGRLRKE